MRKQNLMVAVLLGLLAVPVLAAPTPVLDGVHAILALSQTEAEKHPPVAFQATVTFFRGIERTLFVQDGADGIYVWAETPAQLQPGDRVLIRGTASWGHSPIVECKEISLIRHGDPLRPVPAGFDQLIRGNDDSRMVTVRGWVRSAVLGSYAGGLNTHIQLAVDGGYIHVSLDNNDPRPLPGLLDAEVEITGVAGGIFDSKLRNAGVLLHCSSLAAVKIVRKAAVPPSALPFNSFAEIVSSSHLTDRSRRIRVQGTVTFIGPGGDMVLQNGDDNLWVRTHGYHGIAPGDLIDAAGFPSTRNQFLGQDQAPTLSVEEATILHRQPGKPVQPLALDWKSLASAQHAFDLVTIDGVLETQVRESATNEYVVSAQGHRFRAVFQGSRWEPPAPGQNRMIAPGSHVRVTGICIPESGSNGFQPEILFYIQLQSPSNITITAPPSPLTVRNLTILCGVLLLAVLALVLRGWFLERNVRRQTASLAAQNEARALLERERRRILEKINSSAPLDETLIQITQMVSSRLVALGCWCDVNGRGFLGDSPVTAQQAHILREPLANGAGECIGSLHVALRTIPADAEREVLSMASRMAALALDTHKLNEDLLYRSEFDLLTGIRNRFAFERELEARVERARQSEQSFGLIYIDLNKFKQVNDQHGHSVGDIYLRSAAQRMKQQLRSGDVLARVGGDEFAILVSKITSRAEVNEIAHRLECCFAEPFLLGALLLEGSASIGAAVYGEDGANAGALLIAADMAMYVAKHKSHNAEADAHPVPSAG